MPSKEIEEITAEIVAGFTNESSRARYFERTYYKDGARCTVEIAQSKEDGHFVIGVGDGRAYDTAGSKADDYAAWVGSLWLAAAAAVQELR